MVHYLSHFWHSLGGILYSLQSCKRHWPCAVMGILNNFQTVVVKAGEFSDRLLEHKIWLTEPNKALNMHFLPMFSGRQGNPNTSVWNLRTWGRYCLGSRSDQSEQAQGEGNQSPLFSESYDKPNLGCEEQGSDTQNPHKSQVAVVASLQSQHAGVRDRKFPQ